MNIWTNKVALYRHMNKFSNPAALGFRCPTYWVLPRFELSSPTRRPKAVAVTSLTRFPLISAGR